MKMTDTSIAHCCVVLLAVFRGSGSGSGDGHSSGDSGGGMALLLQNLNI